MGNLSGFKLIRMYTCCLFVCLFVRSFLGSPSEQIKMLHTCSWPQNHKSSIDLTNQTRPETKTLFLIYGKVAHTQIIKKPFSFTQDKARKGSIKHLEITLFLYHIFVSLGIIKRATA